MGSAGTNAANGNMQAKVKAGINEYDWLVSGSTPEPTS